MKFTYIGHAGFKIESDEKTVFVDPWLGAPTAALKMEDIGEADIVLVTHDHGDHGYEEGVQICKKTGATFVAINEIGIQAKSEGGLEKVHTLNIGGSVDIDQVRITLVQAFHSCGRGAPTGFVVTFPSGSFYHAGDTGIFSSMELLRDLYHPDVALLPIGGYYTMDIKQATLATKLLGPKVVIPMHYNTFPVIQADPADFQRAVQEMKLSTEVRVLSPGESTSFP